MRERGLARRREKSLEDWGFTESDMALHLLSSSFFPRNENKELSVSSSLLD